MSDYTYLVPIFSEIRETTFLFIANPGRYNNFYNNIIIWLLLINSLIFLFLIMMIYFWCNFKNQFWAAFFSLKMKHVISQQYSWCYSRPLYIIHVKYLLDTNTDLLKWSWNFKILLKIPRILQVSHQCNLIFLKSSTNKKEQGRKHV